MKKLVLLILLTIVSVSNYILADTIPDNSLIYGIWTEVNSPYIIMKNATVPQDSTLVIEAGVTVKLKSSINGADFNLETLNVGFIKVYGRIIAEGTESDSIIFMPSDAGRWGSISFFDLSEEPNILKYCKVSYGHGLHSAPGGPSYSGIAFYGTNVIIEESTFENNPKGVTFSGATGSITNSTLRFNSTGIGNFSGSSVTISGNLICDNAETGISCQGSSSLISNNIVEGQLKGINCNETNDTISNNIIRNNLWGGIGLGSSNCVVDNNVIYGSNSGIRCKGQPSILNNTIVNNNYFGIYCDAGAKPIIVNSIIFGNSSLIRRGLNDSVVFANSLLQVDSLAEGLINGGGNIYNQNPCFIDEPNEDFSLCFGSPCIDQGSYFFVWGNDTVINLLPDEYFGTAPDMGAFESDYTTGLGSEILVVKDRLLKQNYPNPFSQSTTIEVNLKYNNKSKLDIFNQSGILIKSFKINGIGKHSVWWDRTNYHGERVEQGIYHFRLICEQGIFTRSMIIIN